VERFIGIVGLEEILMGPEVNRLGWKNPRVLATAGGLLVGASRTAAEVNSQVASISTPQADHYIGEEVRIEKNGWNNILTKFDDSNFWQTWSYGAVRWGEHNLAHVVLRKGSEILAAAQVIIIRIPLIGAGIAFVKWGPLWQPRGKKRNPDIFRQMLRTLRDIYAVRMGLLLRVFPHDLEDGTRVMRSILAEEGFENDLSGGLPKTAVIDLSYSLGELRSSLKRQWKQNLRAAERNQLEIIEGVDNDLAEIFLQLHREMKRRKGCRQIQHAAYLLDVQTDLPAALKMTILICEHLREPVAGLAVSMIGSRALAVFAATGDKGLDLRGSYLLHWRMVEVLKARNFRWYDLGEMDHKMLPGISQFKAGLAGKLGRETEYVGQFHACQSTMSSLLVRAGDKLRPIYDMVKSKLS
jgi:hypothetical protein